MRRLLLPLLLLFAALLCFLLGGDASSSHPLSGSNSSLPAEASKTPLDGAEVATGTSTASGVSSRIDMASVASDQATASAANAASGPNGPASKEYHSPHGEIAGRVVDEEGRPVEGAIVSWFVGCTGENHTTGADGRFLLSQAPVTWHDLRVYPPHARGLLGLETVRVRVPRDGAEVDAGDLVLRRSATLRVELGERVESGEVTAVQIGGDAYSATRYVGTLLREGKADAVAELEVPPGPVDVLARVGEAGRWARKRVNVPREGTTVRLTLRPPLRVRARAVDASGAPVRAAFFVLPADGAELLALPGGGILSFDEEEEELSESQSDLLPSDDGQVNAADGRYESGPLLPGRYRVLAIPLDLVHGRASATVLAEATSGEITLVAPLAHSVSIRATEELSGAEVTMWGPAGLTLERTPAGEVRLHGLVTGDRALVLLEGPEGKRGGYRPDWVGSAWVYAGRDAVVTVSPPAQARLLAVNASGEPVGAGYQLRLELADTEGLEWRTQLRKESFNFDDDGEDKSELAGGGFADRDPGPGSYPHAWVTETHADGGTETFDLLPGRWFVSQAGQPRTTIELRAGEERQVQLPIR